MSSLVGYSQSLTRWLLHAWDRHDHRAEEPELHDSKGLTHLRATWWAGDESVLLTPDGHLMVTKRRHKAPAEPPGTSQDAASCALASAAVRREVISLIVRLKR